MEINKIFEINSRKTSNSENFEDTETNKDQAKEQRAIFDIVKPVKQDDISKILRRQSVIQDTKVIVYPGGPRLSVSKINVTDKEPKLKDITRKDLIYK